MANASDLLNQAVGTPTDLMPGPDADVLAQLQALTPPQTNKMAVIPDVAEAKKESVAQASLAKKTAMGGGMTPYQLAVGKMEGLGEQHMSEREADMRNLNPSQLYGKYGSEATNMIMAGAEGFFDVTKDASTPSRDAANFAADTLAAGVTGYGTSLANLGALGVGLINDEAGAMAARGIENVNKFVDSTQSEKLQASKRINEARNALTERDNRVQETIDSKTDGELLAGLKRIGRDAMDSVGNASSDSVTLTDGISSALGSLFAVGPVSSGIRKLGAALVPETTKRGVGLAAAMDVSLGSRSAATLLAGAAEAAPVSLAIGGIEAGGSYQQVTADIMNRSHETMMAEFPEYGKMIEEGISPEAAKSVIASRTGALAAAVTAPAAMAAGALVSKFEGAPLAAKTVRKAVGNAARETPEEAIQGGTSQLAQNYAEQVMGNENKSLSEGVGRQVGEGALYGLGMSAAIAAPALAQDTGRTTMAGIKAVGNGAANALSARADALMERNEKASPVSDEVISQAAAQAQANAPVAEQAMREAAATLSPEQAPAANAYIDKLMASMTFNEGEVRASLAPTVVGVTNRVEAIQKLADQVKASPEGSREELAAGLDMVELLQGLDNVINSDPEAIDAIPEDHPAKAMIREYDSLLANVQNTPKIAAAINTVMQALAKQPAQPNLTENNLNSPQGQEQVRNAITVATVAPDKGDLDTNEQILMHAAQGRINITPEQKAALDTSVALLRAARTADEEAKRLGKADPVSLNLRTEDGEKGKSVVQHAQGVMAAWKAGNRNLATERLFHLHELVTHMGNKVTALNSHLATGNPKSKPVLYEALGQGLEWFTAKKGMFVDPTNEGQVNFAQKVAGEAKLLADVYNGLVTAFPDLGGQHITVTPLDGSLTAPAKQVVAAHKQVKPPVPAPAPVVPVVDAPTTTEKSQEETAPVVAPATPVQTSVKETVQAEPEVTPEPVVEEKPTEAPVKTVAEPVVEPAVVETVVEPTVEPVVAPEPVLKGMQAVFPDLTTYGGKNHFSSNYGIPTEAKTHTFASENPYSLVQDALSSSVKFRAHVGERVKGQLDKDIADAYQGYLGAGKGLISLMDDNLQEFLEGSYSKTIATTPLQVLTEGAEVKTGDGSLYDPLRATKSKILNITEMNDGAVTYNGELIEMATLAGLQWLLTADQLQTKLNWQEAAEVLGIDVSEVTPEQLDHLNKGLSTLQAKRSLADKIIAYWGVSQPANGLIGMQKGIAESVAAEVLRAMVDAGLLDPVSIKLTEDDGLPPRADGKPNVKTFTQLVMTESVPSKDHPVRTIPNAIDQAVLMEPEELEYIGEGNLPKVAQTQLRNPGVKNTPEQLQAIENEQATPYYVNPFMSGFYSALGINNILKLFGAGELDEASTNVNHFKSQEGVNRGLTASFDHLTELLNQVRNQGGELDQTPIHYAFNMTRVARLQMLGKHNPQASKLVREVILPTRSTLDLSSQSTDDYRRFGLGLAQGLGIKVHKMSQENTLKKLQAAVDGPLKESVEGLSNWLKGFDPATQAIEAKYEIPASLVQSLQANFSSPEAKELGLSLSFVALHNLMEYARWQANPTKDFTTSVYLEADGVTNGPVNAMVLFTPGPFSPDWVRNIAKGGLYFNQPFQTVNLHNEFTDNKDLYQATTDLLLKNLKGLEDSLFDNPEALSQMKNLLNLMSLFIGDVRFNDQGDLELSRGVAKNPLTITIYGSGAKGIAAKMTKAITDEIYARLSDVAAAQTADPDISTAQAMFGATSASPEQADENMAKFTKSLNSLIKHWVFKRKGVINVELEPAGREGGFDPVSFTFLPGEIGNLRSSMEHLFVGPMRDAIEATVGGELMSTAKLLQKATQAQSIVLEHAFQLEIEKALAAKAAKDPNFKKSDYLTRAELDGIYKKLEHMSPQINTGTQSFFIAGSEQADSEITNFGQALNDDFRTPAYIYGPKDAGVAGIPFLNIGTGDGQMMQSASVDDNAPTGTLKIFDGAHLPLDQIESGSEVMNKAVFTSWQGNPLKAVHESYKNFMADTDLSNLTPAAQKALIRALFPPQAWNQDISLEEIVAVMHRVTDQLNTSQQEIEARHQVMAVAPISIDQMAAASSPYNRVGELTLQGTSPDDVAAQLNIEYQVKLAAIQKAEPSEAIADAIKAQATQTESGAYVLGQDDLKVLAQTLSLPADQASLFNKLTSGLALKGYSVVFGTPEQVAELAPRVPLANVHGFTMLGNKTIYLLNPSSETLVHELVHAATFENVLSHYNDPSFAKQNPQAHAAVKRLEALMKQFLSLEETMSQVSPELEEAYSDAVGAIKGWQRQGNKAAALNEFMAWGLTNQHLGRLLKRNKASKLAQIAADVVNLIKSMFGIKTGPDKDMFSNLLFNSQMLMAQQPSTSQRLGASVLFMNSLYGEDPRLAEVGQAFSDSIGLYLDRPIQAGVPTPSVVVADAIMTSYRIGESFMAHGFPMNMQQASTFSNIVAALATEAEIDPNAMQAAQKLYSHVMKTITVEDFMADPKSQDINDRMRAQMKLDVLRGRYLAELDVKNRSTLLPSFLALATVDDGFRSILSTMELPKSEKNNKQTLDALLENVGNAGMESLTERMSGVKKTANIQQAVDSLNAHITDLVQKRESHIDQMASKVGGVIDRANDYVVEGVTVLSEKLMASASRAQRNAGNRVTRLVTGLGAGLAAVIHEPSGQIVSKGVMSAMNKGNVWRPFHELVNDVVGRTKSNANVYDMIKAVRSMVQKVRQQFREDLPVEIAKRFSRDLTTDEWQSLFRSMGKTDLAVLRGKFSNQQIMDMVSTPAQLKAEVKQLEDFLKMEDPTHFPLLKRKMEQLAEYMNTGFAGRNLLRNAHAVANLFGENKGNSWTVKGADFTQAVDQLVTLYAVQTLNQGDRDTLASLVQGEAEGLGFTLSYLVGQREEEQRKANDPLARNNAFKGYIPTERDEGVSMLIADDSEFAKLAQKSYVRVADYNGSPLDRMTSTGYYYAPVAARSTFEQGIMQNVRQSVSGVDARTGFTNSIVAGRITEPGKVKAIARNLHRDQGPETLLPVYGANGEAVAFEKSLDVAVMEQVHKDSSLHTQIGIWRGRQVEESMAGKFNEALIDGLKAMYDQDLSESLSNQKQYVNLSTTTDPVLMDAVSLFSPETREYIDQVFGGELYVRKDMLNDALGYRAASIGDAWSGNSRWSPKTQEVVKNLALSIGGNDAYKTLVNAEKTLNNIVSDARVLIVVKSVVVPLTNLMSNVYQLIGRGVPLSNIVKGMGKKTAEIDAYVKSRLREIAAEAELRAATGDPREQRKLTAELQAIQDSYRRMSIWPLIEAGEFSSISDVGLSRSEVLLTSGRMQAYMEHAVNQLPTPIATLGRYALVTKDTALFQGMQKAVEYGDFLAKSVLYDDLTKRQGMSKEEALGRISEEFVNYDRLPGRFRGTLENLGLLWFYNFKIRSTKVALSMIRNNPVHTLLSLAAPKPDLFGSVGLPVIDNMFSKLADGTLDYSIGPSQGLHSMMLNPWVNLTQ